MGETNTRKHNGQKDTKANGKWLVFALIIGGLVLTALVGAEGSPGWRVVRIGIVVLATGAAIWVAQAKPRLGGAVALLFGAVGLCVGIVFGYRFLTVDGISWRAALGLIDVPVALALLILGARQLLSGIHKVAQIVGVPALVVAVAFVVWVITPPVLATNVPPVAESGSILLQARVAHYPAADGTYLTGWYIPSSNGSAVILRHGSGSTATDVFGQAAVLAKHGYGVLATDARGHGMSGGRAMDFGWYGDTDIEAAISFLVLQPGISANKIAVVGMSMGGEEAIGALAGEPRIAAVVAEGVTGRTEADKVWMADVYGFAGRIQTGIEWLQYSLANVLTDADKPVSLADALKAAKTRPVLIITAGDVEDEQHTADYLQKTAPASVSVWNVPGAGHTQGLAVAPEEWEKTVTGFLDTALND